jgi:EthD domain
MRYVRRDVLCHSITEAFSGTPGAASPFDGIAEMWGDSVDDVKRALAEPRYMEVIRPDEEKFLDLPHCVFMVTEEVPMKG